MSETAAFRLPLLQPAQAQKHVTVNEALLRLDGMVQLRLASVSLQTPPVTPDAGAVYHVPAGATGAWSGQDGWLALYQNGGWVFVEPRIGWRAWLLEEGREALFDGVEWVATPVTSDATGAAGRFRTVSFDHAVGAGGVSMTAQVIPAGSMIFAVSARVVSPLTGSLSSWRLGDGGQDNRYGSGLGTATGSYAEGLLGSPMTVYSDTPLLLSATGGTFTGGVVRIAAHVFSIDLPSV